MSRFDSNQRFVPSLLDRLIDPQSSGTSWGQGYSIVQMSEAVRRDLEDLLNTRQTDFGIPEIFDEVHKSIVGYGLPDLALVDSSTKTARTNIGRVIEEIIGRFEPRLRDVRATLVETLDRFDRSVRYQIEARLAIEPCPEIGFETVLELTTGHTTIKQRGP